MTVTYFEPFGPSMDSVFNKAKAAVFLFRRTIMFGVQKTVDKFKLKFSCRASEVVWDFSREHGLDSIMLYTPFGGLFLKCARPKGTLPNFERNRWRSGVDKISAIEEADEALRYASSAVPQFSWSRGG
jgi:hypothetical protein